MDSVGFKIQCKDCGFCFYICKRCYRGQVYCSSACRQRGYRKTRRKAQEKYRRSPEAREDHREAQQRYRNRNQQNQNSAPQQIPHGFSVIDQSSEIPNDAIDLNLTDHLMNHQPLWTPPPCPVCRCRFCGRDIDTVFRSRDG